MRVGRGIAAGKGKTAGRGTKGQKARAGASIPPWFEGGQTPIHMRVPKLHGFRPIGRIDYQVVNIGRISAYAEAGRLGEQLTPRSPYTVNPEILRAAGLITRERQPVKILGAGEVAVPLFVLADAFTASAQSKVEAAGGSVQTIAPAPIAVTPKAKASPVTVTAAPVAPATDEPEGPPTEATEPAPRTRRARAAAAEAAPAEDEAAPAEDADAADAEASSEADADPTDAAPQA
jgi:large subunit ribosomal protein L15